jgi:hypothetical protein
MNITPNEVDSIEDAGMLDGKPVKMIRTKGGFWIAVGKPRGKFKEEAIAAGSHPAIVKFNVEKQYPDFQPAMMKSEHFSDGAIVEKHSHFLSEDLRKTGHDIYSVQTGNEIDFQITKHGIKVLSVGARLGDEILNVEKTTLPQQFVRAVSGATVEKCASSGAKSVHFVPGKVK